MDLGTTSSLQIIKDYFMFRLNEWNKLSRTLPSDYFRSRRLSTTTTDITFTFRALAYEGELFNRDEYDRFIDCVLFARIDNVIIDDFFSLIVKLQQLGNVLFGDKRGVDWPRIVSFVSFVSYVSFKFARLNRDLKMASRCACKLIEWSTSYLTCKCGLWIECNGGWVN